MLSKTVCSAKTPVICGANASAKALNKMGQFSNSDLEHRKRIEEALHVNEHDLRVVIDSIPGFVRTNTAAGEIEFVNQPFLNYLGKTLEEVKDWLTALHPDDRERVKAEWSRSLETGQPFDTEVRIRRADGVYRWFNARCTPLREAEGRIVRWYNLLTDIDERRRSEEKLRRSESYLSEAQKLSQTGSFGWDVSSGEIYWSEETSKIFQHDRAVKPTLELVLQQIHPDDRDRVQQALDHATNEKTDFDIEHRLLMPDSSVKHVHALARALETSSGNLEYVGAVTDVTAAKQAEESLRESQAYLAEAQRLSHTGSWAWAPGTG